ncbi:MAG: TonB-dependent receptor plug domain-containing protein, partial [Thermoanaerobaculia bacterium]
MKLKWISVLFVLGVVLPLRAADEAGAPLPLDLLLDTPITTAAKYDQRLSSVAASVTVISAEEIERYGWTTMTEVLEALPGIYSTYDRNYTYIGVRGIGRPTDGNTRLLVLMNGQPLNDVVFGGAPIEEIHPGTIDRIEVVRGPGSALYGSHAMLAVINIITKTADAIDGGGLSAAFGTSGTETLGGYSGTVFHNGMKLTTSAQWERARGADLYFPEYDSPATGLGIARGRDYTEWHALAATLERGNLRFSASTRSRSKGIPTGSYDTLFNGDSNTQDTDDRASVEYHHSAGVGKGLELRGYWDRATYHGHYVYDVVGRDDSLNVRVGGEARMHWDIHPNQRLTGGMELARSSTSQYNYVVGDYEIHLSEPVTQMSAYLEDEYHPTGKIGIVVGGRFDRYSYSKGSASPRAAILFTPNRSTTVKLLYGSAFRTPSLYEREYQEPGVTKVNHHLRPETIRTTELVLEQRLHPALFFVGSVFHISASDLVNTQMDPTDGLLWSVNIGSLTSNGIETGL